MLPVFTTLRKTLIITDSWPVWLQVLTPSRGFNCLAVLSTSLQHSDAWLNFDPNVPWFEFSVDDDITIAWPSTQLIAVSGTSTFVDTIIRRDCQFDIVVSLNLHHSPMETTRHPPWFWYSWVHSSYGGVTTGKYWCGSNFLSLAPKHDLSSRRLCHVLHPVVRGRPHPLPPDAEASYSGCQRVEGHLHIGGFLSPTDPRTKVICPSVFSKSGWVSRSLMVGELAACWDVVDPIVKLLPQIQITGAVLKDLAFMNSAPAKLLQAFVYQAPIIQSTPMPKTFNPTVLSPPTRTQLETPEYPLGRDKAAKNDDAEIPVAYWDDAVLEPRHNFTSVKDRIEAYTSRFLQSPLTALRKFALWFWRRCV